MSDSFCAKQKASQLPGSLITLDTNLPIDSTGSYLLTIITIFSAL